MLVAAVELRTLGALIDRLEMPTGATLAVFDRSRTILARQPDSALWVGMGLPAAWEVLRQQHPMAQFARLIRDGPDGSSMRSERLSPMANL